MLFFSLAAALAASVSSPTAKQSDLRFEITGAAFVSDQTTPHGERLFRIAWQRIPQESEFPGINREKLVHRATISARCLPASEGKLKDCELIDELPAMPELRPLFHKALDLLVMQPSSAKQVKDAPFILVSVLMSNPGGADSDKGYCAPPFCSVVPSPPPAPELVPTERG